MSRPTAQRLARRFHARDDEGIALITVLGFTAVLAALIAVGTAIGVRALQSSAQHANFEAGLATAEAGVDQLLADITADYNANATVNYVMPNPTCSITTMSATYTDENAERTAARNALTALPDSCLQQGTAGQYIAVRPSNRQAVYSMSWVPYRGAPGAKSRLVKAEYLFAPYKPSNAVLTQGNIDFSGSVAVRTLSDSPSDVHSNNNVSGFNGSTNIQGNLSASGTLSGSCSSGITGGCTAASPIQSLPTISARSYYPQSVKYPGSWFDLCNVGGVGVMKAPGATPCTGTTLSSTNGWVFTAGSGTTPDTWTLPRTAGGPYNGIYYVYQGNAVIGSNGNSSDTWQMSVLAEAAPTGGTTTTCGKKGGDVVWKLFNMQPFLSGLQLLADANLTGDANSSAGSGLFLAADKVDLQTSSAVISGAVIASNRCAAQGPNTIQGMTINYDDTLEAPLSDIIRTTLWLDYAAGS